MPENSSGSAIVCSRCAGWDKMPVLQVNQIEQGPVLVRLDAKAAIRRVAFLPHFPSPNGCIYGILVQGAKHEGHESAAIRMEGKRKQCPRAEWGIKMLLEDV